MYEAFYGLKEPPFNLTPDSHFLYMSRRHHEAMAALLYGIRERKGFVLLTGEIGSGKTTLCRALLNEFEGTDTQVALILDSYLDTNEMLETIHDELGVHEHAHTRKGWIDALTHFLAEQAERNQTVALVIDEAQNLADSVLEQIRLLGNLETEQRKLLQVVLIGQPELVTTLQQPKLEQLNQRIAVRYHLRALEAEDVAPYIRHRLRVAGASGALEFTPKAVKMLYELTGGIPRKINILCDRALLAGYVASTRTIDDAIVRTAAMEVGVEQWSGGGPATRPTHSASRARRLLRPAVWLGALAVIFLVAVVGMLFNLDKIRSRRPSAPGRKTSAPTPAKPDFPATQMIPPEPAPFPPSPEITPAPLRSVAPWTYDENRVVRVNRPEFARTAAILTVLGAWGIEVNLEDFRRLTPEGILHFDVIQANQDLGLRQIEILGGIRDLLVYDLPAVAELADPARRLSPYVALLGATADTCQIADPVTGLQRLSRDSIESCWRRAVIIYFDPDNLDKLERGQRAEGVRVVQQALSDLGFYRGAITGEYDLLTVGAIESLQLRYDIAPTGGLDPLTVMLVTGLRHPDRPRLASHKEHKP